MACCKAKKDSDRWCCLNSAERHDFLKLIPDSEGSLTGTYEWTTDKPAAEASAFAHYKNAEGISRIGSKLYFVAKTNQQLFILDLDNMTYVESSTVSGAFNRQPDQIQTIVSDKCTCSN